MLVKSAAGFPHETGGTQRIPALPNTLCAACFVRHTANSGAAEYDKDR